MTLRALLQRPSNEPRPVLPTIVLLFHAEGTAIRSGSRIAYTPPGTACCRRITAARGSLRRRALSADAFVRRLQLTTLHAGAGNCRRKNSRSTANAHGLADASFWTSLADAAGHAPSHGRLLACLSCQTLRPGRSSVPRFGLNHLERITYRGVTDRARKSHTRTVVRQRNFTEHSDFYGNMTYIALDLGLRATV